MNDEPAPKPDRLVLELIPDRDPIEGALSATGAARRQFRGWMELVAALEEARGRGEKGHPIDRGQTTGRGSKCGGTR